MPKHVCDFRCWYAKGSVCKCWCCGLNHGVGRTPEGADEKYGYTEADYELFLKKLAATTPPWPA